MELNDAARRILGQHWKLILLFVALGVAIAALAHAGDEKTYSASTRLALDMADPEDRAESESIADTAEAIALSPARVKAALRRAGISGRDPVETAENDVSVQGLGASGIMELSVRDPNPRAAAAMSEALAKEVIRTRANVTGSQFEGALGDLNRRIRTLNRTIARLEAGRTRGREQTAQRDSLMQERAVLESARVSALSDDSQRPRALLVSPAIVPGVPEASSRLPDMALGILLGLVLGVGVAALIETVRPTLVGRGALARELNTPVLGTLPSGAHADAQSEEAADISGRLGMAAKIAGVGKVGLLPARRDLDLEPLARGLDAGVQVQPFDFQSSTGQNGSRTGLVLVSPTTLKREELEKVINLLRVSPGPLIGLVTYESREHGY